MEDEYPQLQIIPTLHKVDTVANTLVPFVLINLGEDFIFLPKGQVVGFLDPEYIDVSEINLDIASVTINAQSIPSTMKEKIVTKNQGTIPSDFITSPADVEGPHKADLQDFEISEEERKAKAQKHKKEQEEKEQEKARLKREAHKEVLKIAKEMSSKTAATSTVVRAEDVSIPLATPAEPSTSQQDPLETSLMETGPQLVSLIPFEESEEEMIRPTSTGAARVLSQTISIEGSVPKPQKVIAGKEPRPAGPKSAGTKSAGPKSAGSKSASPKSAGPQSASLRSAGPKSTGLKPTGSKLVARKEPNSAGLKSAGPMPASAKPVEGRPARPSVGGKAPRPTVGGKVPRPTIGGKAPRK